jgi:tight adherence protein B
VRPLHPWRTALLTAAAVILIAEPASAASPASGRITSLRASAGQVQFLLSVDGLAPTAKLNPGSVQVRFAGQQLGTTAESPGSIRSAETPGTALSRAAMIVLDSSGSMGTTDWKAAQQGALAYLRRLPKDISAGLTTTGTGSATRLALAPTTNRAMLTTAIRALRPGGNTALYDAMNVALAQLKHSAATERRIIVMSDGRDSASRTSLAVIVAQLSRERVPADVVAFKTQATSETTLQQLANAAKGHLFRSPDAQRMVTAFANAASTFSQSMWITTKVPPALAGKAGRLDVQVIAGRETVRAYTSVTFTRSPAKVSTTPPARQSPVAPAADNRPARSPLSLVIVLGVFFVALTAVVIAAISVVRGTRGPEWARQVDEYRAHDSATAGPGSEPTPLLRGALNLSQRVIRSGDLEERIARDLDHAGMSMRPHEWILLRGGSAIVLAAVLTVTTGNLFVGPVLGVLIAWAGGRLYVKTRLSRRLTAFADQLPDALQLVAGSLRSGFTVSQSLERLAQRETQPLGEEMARALAQTRLGISIEEALDTVADRMECQDLHWVVLAIRIQREVGGNLADVIDTTVETMRERTRLRGHIRALSAEGRLSAYVLIALPIVTSAVLFVIRPQYMRPLYTQPLGILMLIGGTTAVTIGAFWINRLIKVET